MFSVTVFKFSFTSSWKTLFFALLIVGILIGLGIWQLHRASEKRHLLDQFQSQKNQSPMLLSSPDAQQYQRVKTEGVARLPLTFLLDNQHHNHQFGYDVLTPLELKDGQIILIDQGWIKGDVSRLTLPILTQLPTTLQYCGQVYYPAKHPFSLGVGLEKKTSNLVIIESLDMKMVSQFLHKPVYPFIIRLFADENTSWVRDWPIITTSPIRHIGYAIQWFSFALGALIMYIILHTKRQA